MSTDPHEPEAGDQAPEKKSSQQLLLLVLLFLVALFGYLYFFTGLIRPRPEANEPKPAETAQVKKPLPPRKGKGETAAEKPSAPVEKGKETAQENASAQTKGPAAVAKQTPAPGKETKPAIAQQTKGAQAAKEGKGAEAPAVKPEGVKKSAQVLPHAAPAPAAKHAAAKEAQPAAAQKAAPPAKPQARVKEEVKPTGAKRKEPATKEAKQVPAKPVATTAGSYLVELAADVLESEYAGVQAKMKKAGIDVVEKTKLKKGETMHRLFLADFASHDEATESLERLKSVAPDAFLLGENGRYVVYAGSYLRAKKAALEQDRLYDKGVKLLLRDAVAPVTVLKVRAGCFCDKPQAEQMVQRLKKVGLEAKIVKAAK